MERKSRFSSQESDLEQERRAREKQEASGGKKISTLHRDSDFTLECADGRVSPPPSSSSSPRPPPLSTARSAGQLSSGSGRANRTDISVRYGPSRMNGAPRANGGGQGGREAGLGEFERRLLNAKRLGKAPMPSVDQIPWYHPSISRHIAESLLMHRDILNGTYLLRNSSNSDSSLTLSVRCRTALRHYRVHWDGRQFCFGLGKFPDVISFQDHFKQQPMISGDCGVLVKLAHPYPRGVVEPHDYQEANELSSYASGVEATVELTSPSLSVNSKEGFLTKLGYHRKNWKFRWFTLFRNELKYFNTKDDKWNLSSMEVWTPMRQNGIFFFVRYESTVAGKAAITTSTNEAYGKVKAAEGEEYEMVDIPPPATPAKVEEMYEVPSSPNQPLPPPPSLPSPPPAPLVGAGDEVVYDFIPGDQ